MVIKTSFASERCCRKLRLRLLCVLWGALSSSLASRNFSHQIPSSSNHPPFSQKAGFFSFLLRAFIRPWERKFPKKPTRSLQRLVQVHLNQSCLLEKSCFFFCPWMINFMFHLAWSFNRNVKVYLNIINCGCCNDSRIENSPDITEGPNRKCYWSFLIWVKCTNPKQGTYNEIYQRR